MEGRLLDRQMGEVKNQPNDHTDEDESEALNEGAEDKMSDCEADWSDYESGSDMEEDEEDIIPLEEACADLNFDLDSD